MVFLASLLNLFLLTSLRVLSSVAYETLTDKTLQSLPSPNDDYDIKDGPLLAPILRTRVPGTPGSLAVLQHFVDFFTDNLPDWEITYHNTTGKTPATGYEEVPFRNLIVSRDPPWAKPGDVSRLTLVAHYDSKLTPEGFIGATDSAAPCAMLMHIARSLDKPLTRKWEAMQKRGEYGLDQDMGIQILFLDGEEAFVNWTEDDSIYGAR
jgi:glutaminyl-peptide cyclotransferase